MKKLSLVLVFAVAVNAYAQDSQSVEKQTEIDEVAAPAADALQGPRAMSGMSVLGNEEAPKSLVIVPWKSSELGDHLSLSDSLDDRAQPVDKEVFMRELKFFEIRSSE